MRPAEVLEMWIDTLARLLLRLQEARRDIRIASSRIRSVAPHQEGLHQEERAEHEGAAQEHQPHPSHRKESERQAHHKNRVERDVTRGFRHAVGHREHRHGRRSVVPTQSQ